MPFIGKQPQAGAYSKLDSITTSATATYNLTLDSGAYYPQSANHLLVSLNGVIQAPQDSFTVSGSQIIFDSALTSADVIDFIIALGDTLDIGVPSAGSVNTSQLANNAVTSAKITYPLTTFSSTGIDDNATSTAMTLDSVGRILIGGTNTAPGFGNTVTGLNLSNDGRFFASVTSESHSLNRNSTDGDILQFRQSGSTVGSIASTTRSGTTDIFIGSGDTGIYFTQALDAVAPSNQGSDRDAAIDLGRSANRFKDLYLSGGVVFGTTGGTVTSKTLDDYEEGTFTPTLYHSSTNDSTFSSVNGQYTKIGNTVTCQLRIDNGTSGTAGSFLVIGGLPFAVSQAQGNMGIGIWGSNPSSQFGNIHGFNPPRVFKGGTDVTTQMSFFTAMLVYKTS